MTMTVVYPIAPDLAWLDDPDSPAYSMRKVLESNQHYLMRVTLNDDASALAAVLTVYKGLFPVVARTDAYDVLRAECAEAMLTRLTQVQPTDPPIRPRLSDIPVKGSFFQGADVLERITGGHFRPERTPGGFVVHVGRFTLRPAHI